MIDEIPDYHALNRIWSTREWFRFTGLTQRQRDGVTERRRDRGQRGAVVLCGVRTTADVASGEVIT